MMMYGSSAGLLDRVSVLKSRAKASISVSHQCRYIYMYFCFITSRSGKEASGAYDHLGELDQALFMYLDHGSSHGHGGTQQEQRRKCVRMHALRRSLTTDRPKFNCSCRVFCLPSCVFVFAASQMQLTSSSNVLDRRLVQQQLISTTSIFWLH